MNRESIFQIIRDRWNAAPVDVTGIIRDAGLTYYELALPSNVSGMIEQSDGRHRIVVNASDSLPRKRFTAAHELGHYIYHRHLIGQGITDNRLYRAGTGRHDHPQIREKHETEANRFAANLLMPKHLLKELQDKKLSMPQMAAALGVSVPAMRVRLGHPPYPSGAEEFGDMDDDDFPVLSGQLSF